MMALPFDTSVVCPVLIGREAALASFARVFAQVTSGQGRTVLVSGEAGIGKSRLVAEVTARLGSEQAQVLRGICFEQDRTLPFAPLLDMLRTLLLSCARDASLCRLASRAPALLTLLPSLALWLPDVRPMPPLEPEEEKRRLFVALSSFLLDQAEQRPLVLVIEDLHWSDETSLAFLLFLIRQSRVRPLLLVLTYRQEEVHPALAHFLSALDRERVALSCSLTALSQEEVHAMLRATFQLKKPVRRDFLEALYQLTEGNPFFVEEMLKSLLATGDIFFSEGNWDRKPLAQLRIPRSVFDAVQQRSSLLSEMARETLELTAVVGRPVEVSLLQALTGCSEHELLACLDTLIAVQLLVETSSGQYAFRHALTRAAVYTGLRASKRKALHLRIGHTLERLSASSLESHLAELAFHFYQAQAWQEALAYAQRVGEKALALCAPRTALEHLTHALEAARHLSEANPGPLFHARGQAYEYLGDFDAARSDFEQAREKALAVGDCQAEWKSLMALGTLWTTRDYPSAGDFFRRALDLAQALADPCTYAHSQNRLAAWSIAAGELAVGITLYEESLALFRQHGETRDVARTLEFLALAAAFAGDMHRSVSYYEQAIALLRALGDKGSLAACLPIRSCVMSPVFTEAVTSAGRTLAGCKQDLEEALQLADETEWRSRQAIAHVVAGWVFASFGELGEGLAHARTALEMTSELEHRPWMVGAYYGVGILHLLLLDPQQAMSALEAGLAIARTQRSPFWMGNIAVALAQASLLAGEISRAAAILEQAMPAGQAPCNLWERRLAWAWGQLALAQRKPDLALRRANTLLASAQGDALGEQGAMGQGGASIPALLQLRGEALFALGRLDEAILALEEARRGTQEQGARPLLWQIHRALGRVYVSARQKQQAQYAYAAAREVIADLAVSLDEAEQRDRFLHAALTSLPKERPLTPRQSARLAFGGLSERQREIALLIAQGKSSREIAEALVISQRTVETHVGKIYTKLGFNSRTQLAAWVAEKGLALPSLC
jgi:DNA-binding CsgD family transcriptional regulator